GQLFGRDHPGGGQRGGGERREHQQRVRIGSGQAARLAGVDVQGPRSGGRKSHVGAEDTANPLLRRSGPQLRPEGFLRQVRAAGDARTVHGGGGGERPFSGFLLQL